MAMIDTRLIVTLSIKRKDLSQQGSGWKDNEQVERERKTRNWFCFNIIFT